MSPAHARRPARRRLVAAAVALGVAAAGATGGWLAGAGVPSSAPRHSVRLRLGLGLGPGSGSGQPDTAGTSSSGAVSGSGSGQGSHGRHRTGSGSGSASSSMPTTAAQARRDAHLPTAPPGTVAHLDALYAEIYQTVQATGVPQTQIGGDGGLPAPASYDRLTASLTSRQRSELYVSTRSHVRWASMTATFEQLASLAAAHPLNAATGSATAATTGTAAATAAASARWASAHLLGASATFPPTPPSGPFAAAPAPYQASPPVAPASGIVACPSGAPGADYGEAGIFAANEVAELLNDAANWWPNDQDIEVASVPVSVDVVIPNPVRIILAVAALAAQTAQAALEFVQTANANCVAANWVTYLSNVDSTTINTYDLLVQLQSTVDNLQSSVDTLSGQVQTVQQTADEQLQIGIEQALTAGPGTPPNAAYELPASEGGNLNSTPVGVQSVVTGDIAAAKQAGLPVNQAATRYLAMANAALDQGNWSLAYADYVTAYQQAAQ